ncbi:ribosome-assembly protein 3-domain-containing protein [Xylariaceae sp. FL1019]|nr:ribosome-assembly protein 3-domain-containing protein [Xylariaceae sp. FL1019]
MASLLLVDFSNPLLRLGQHANLLQSYYLQQSTKEFAEDLEKIRKASDFKGDAVPMLVKSLQQGTSMFSPAEQKRVADARGADEAEDDSTHSTSSSSSSSSSSSIRS